MKTISTLCIKKKNIKYLVNPKSYEMGSYLVLIMHIYDITQEK